MKITAAITALFPIAGSAVILIAGAQNPLRKIQSFGIIIADMITIQGGTLMKYRKFGRTGFDISAVSYGGIVSMDDGQPASDRYVAWAIERGVNYFDVAPSYGDAEEKLGNSLKPYRKDVHLACKTGERLREGAEKELNRSLRNLHTDYFDVYQLHGIASMQEVETAFGPGGVMEMVSTLKQKGVAANVGITAHNEEAALFRHRSEQYRQSVL